MENRLSNWLSYAVLAAFAACSPNGVPSGGKCTGTAQCKSGLFCEAGACTADAGVVACTKSSDCANGRSCEQGACVLPATGAGSPVITNVNVDAAGGTITVQGTGLADATSATLTGNGGVSILTVNSGATATKLVASAATTLTLVAGVAYDLVVKSASAQSAPVTINYTIPNDSVLPANLSSACTAGQSLTVGASNSWSCAAPTVNLPVYYRNTSPPSGDYVLYCSNTDLAIGGGCHAGAGGTPKSVIRSNPVLSTTGLGNGWECDCVDSTDTEVACAQAYVICVTGAAPVTAYH